MFSFTTKRSDDGSDSSSNISIPNALTVKAAVTNVAHGPIKMKRTGQGGMPAGRSYAEYSSSLSALRATPPSPKLTSALNAPVSSVSATNTPRMENNEDIEFVTSDVIRQSPRKLPDSTEHSPVPALKAQPPAKLPERNSPDTGEMPKKKMSEAQRRLISENLKRRWAEGRMSHIHDKMKANKRKSMASVDNQAAKPNKKHRESLSSPFAADVSESGDVWEYLQPFLVHYRGESIPNQKRIRDLLHMPRVRDVEWNEFAKRSFSDNSPQSLMSIILHVIGELQEEPCFRCKEHKGPFKGCVKLPEGLHFSIPHCSNCSYSHQVCSVESWVGAKRNSNVHESQSAVNSDEFDSRYIEVEDTIEADSAENPINDLVGNETLISNIEPILEAPSGRSYDDWVDDQGDHISQDGQLLFPHGYMLNEQDKARPWTCPIADCKGTFARRADLRFHFPRKHYAAMLNDNLDGTFEFLGYYDDRRVLRPGGGFPIDPPSLPVVVSQTSPKNTADKSPARPSPRMKPRKADYDDDDANLAPMSESAILQSMTPADARKARAMWDYIQPHLHHTRTIPASGHVKELLPSTRVRDLKWNPNSTRSFIENKPRDISSMIVQVTGEQAPSPCSECAKGKGIFDGCVVIDRNANPAVRSCIISCANCNYHGRQSGCSIKQWVQEREQPPYPPYFNPKAKRTSEIRKDTSELPEVAVPSPAPPETAESATGEVAVQHGRSFRPRQSQVGTVSSSALIATGQVPSADEMEKHDMEEWEIAPGRIRSQVSDGPDNIAMSHAFLGASHGTQISPDLTARLADIRGGTTLRLEAEGDKVRFCLVVNGKLKVRIDGEQEFVIGPHGMFKVRPGAACTALNTSYFWALVSIITQND